MCRWLALGMAATAFLGAGCATQITEELIVVDADKVRLRAESAAEAGANTQDDTIQIGGMWRRSLEPFERQEQIVQASVAKAQPASPAMSAPRKQTALDRLIARDNAPAPRKNIKAPKSRAKPQRIEGQQAVKSAARLARDHYLDFPTRIVAQRITFYVPADVARELRVQGDDDRQTHPTRRLIRGNAKAFCRELTLEAERITIRIREEPDADLQVTALGNVTLVSTVRKQTTREEGLKSMLITNDKLVPLR